MNDAIWGFIGTLVGGLVVLFGTYLTLNQNINMEMRRLKLSQLVEKKIMIERLFSNHLLNYTGNMEEDQYSIVNDYNTISEFIYLKSHYFSDLNEFQKIETGLNDIENDSNLSPQETIYNQMDLNNKVYKFMKVELNKTMKRMNKLIENDH